LAANLIALFREEGVMSFRKIISKRPPASTRGFTIVEVIKPPGQPEIRTGGREVATGSAGSPAQPTD
jgi:hypothetical protein